MSEEAFLILHGLANHRPPEHWQHWLASRLRAAGLLVRYPALPDPDRPDPERWEAALDDELAALGGRRTVVVAHSLACLLWMRAAQARPQPPRAGRLLLVSPPAGEDLPAEGSAFRLRSSDYGPVRASADEIRIACSDADPYNRAGAASLYAGLGAPVDVIAGAGHITPGDGYGPWPSCERWCLGLAERLGPN